MISRSRGCMVSSAETQGTENWRRVIENWRRVMLLSCAGRALGGFLLLMLVSGGVRLSAVDTDGQINAKMPKKLGPHPDAPRGQRAGKNALTEQVSRRLPPAKRLEVTRKNYIDDYIFGKME